MHPSLHAKFPNASQDVIALNAQRAELPNNAKDRPQVAFGDSKLERDPSHAALAKRQTKKGDSERYVVRIVSVRTRLLDEDNLCEKYVVDFLRYCGAIPDDAPGKTKIEITQRKAKNGEEEHTEIKVWKLWIE